MVITRETDYALRILRSLLDGELHTVGSIAQEELLPQPFAYKIIKKAVQGRADPNCPGNLRRVPSGRFPLPGHFV